MEFTHTPECFANHMTTWAIDPVFLAGAIAAIQDGTMQAREGQGGGDLFQMTRDGVAVINMVGPMMKGESKFGGVSTVNTRRALRQAAADPEVSSIMLRIDSPGGTVAGTNELAQEVVRTRLSKPVTAAIEDLGASAAFWVASQADHISINATGEVGSIGTMAVLQDSSKAAEMAGIEVHVISTGDFKGAGAPGTEVTDEHLSEMQARVDNLNRHFLQAVATGRGLSLEDVKNVATGKVFGAADAVALGLVDSVSSTEDALTFAAEMGNVPSACDDNARARASAMLKLHGG